MKLYSSRLAGLLTGLALVLFFTATPTLKADEWNLETRIMADHQIEVPGAMLEANTPYIIKLMDSPSERHVVQVFDENQDHLISEFIAVSAERRDPVDKTTFQFMETPAGHPVPVQTWFYPGRSIGLEFLYPKDQTDKFASYWKINPIQRVAQAPAAPVEAATPVPSSDPVTIAELDPETTGQTGVTGQKSDISEIERSKPTEPVLAEPAPTAPVQTAQNAETTTPLSQDTPRELPRTAGELQLLGLFGALSATLGAIRLRR